jgi:hypothetical protein
MSGNMQWFRLYSRIVDDEKLRLLAFEDRWHFVALCCLKSTGLLDEPNSELKQRRVAVKLGVQLRELDEISRRLQAVSLIDGHLNPLAWDELQFRSDGSTERVREWRKKQQNQAGNKAKRSRNVTATAQEAEPETEELEAKASCASGDALKPDHVFEKWNLVASRIGKPRVRDATPTRRQLVRARIAQYSLDDFMTVFGRIEASPFLRGDRQWQGCTFDWAMKRANFQKILEGNYDN